MMALYLFANNCHDIPPASPTTPSPASLAIFDKSPIKYEMNFPMEKPVDIP